MFPNNVLHARSIYKSFSLSPQHCQAKYKSEVAHKQRDVTNAMSLNGGVVVLSNTQVSRFLVLHENFDEIFIRANLLGNYLFIS